MKMWLQKKRCVLKNVSASFQRVETVEIKYAKSYPSGLKGAVIGLCKKGDTTVYLFLLNNILQDIDDV